MHQSSLESSKEPSNKEKYETVLIRKLPSTAIETVKTSEEISGKIYNCCNRVKPFLLSLEIVIRGILAFLFVFQF
ncbi:hypothetical protein NPIL_561411 [Nephila pilipes]|uniref:Uncharacterized protein n=1 Tax=Nephila pilipes TaxID=299642 RepID=A0A8X6QQH8_NEPPI|nr:hypothetical protein NPIL_561411 [Nephila pilipes]